MAGAAPHRRRRKADGVRLDNVKNHLTLRHLYGQPLRRVAGRQAPPGCAGASADGGPVREGQPAVTRAALQRSCCAVRRDCARGHGGACGAAEHSGLSLRAASEPRSLEEVQFSVFLLVFLALSLNANSTPKKAKRDTGPFFVIFERCHSKFKNDVKNDDERQRAFLSFFVALPLVAKNGVERQRAATAELAQVYPYQFCQDLAHILLRHLVVKPLDNEVYLLEPF